MKIIALSSLLVACNNIENESSDSSEPASSGSYSWGSGGSSGSDEESEDPVDTASDDTASTGGTDSGTDDTDTSDTGTDVVETVNALLYIATATEWESSLDWDGEPTVCMYNVANYTADDWTDFGATCAGGEEQDGSGFPYDQISYTPGDTLVVNADWFDGYSNRYFADTGNTVRSRTGNWNVDPIEMDVEDDEKALVIYFGEGDYDVYLIDSTGDVSLDTALEGEAYYVDDGSANVYISTWR